MSTPFQTIEKALGLMRGRAEQAYGDRWAYDLTYCARTYEVRAGDDFLVAEGIPGEGLGRWTAEHIASWPPVVALEVAKWLDTVLAAMSPPTGSEATILGRSISPVDEAAALAVARAYLGEES